MHYKLKGGSLVTDIRLGRVVQFDERSRNFPLMETAEMFEAKPRSHSWRMDSSVLDQGNEGACVGFGISHELKAYPAEVQGVTYDSAMEIYHEAQKIDEWPGENYSGTSVLAGLKTAKAKGFFDEYRWTFSLDELILGVGHNGPAVMGTVWYDGMYTPTKCCGRIYPTGSVVGGHCYLLVSVDVKREVFTMLNSWGPGWGNNGRAEIGFADMDTLLQNQGEAAFAMHRHTTGSGVSFGSKI